MENGLFYHINLGLMSYGEALGVQEHVHDMVTQQRIRGALITVQHHNVLTFGKNATDRHLLVPTAYLQQNGVETFHVERGGEVTAHSPGQLVIYPIVPLSHAEGGLPFTPVSYVHLLESAVIELLAGYDVCAQTREQYPGVWVKDRKICAIGVRIKQRVTLHGLALNVSNDLKIFSMIVPCGIAGAGVTSVCQELACDVDLASLASKAVVGLASKLGINVVEIAYNELTGRLLP